MKNLNLKYLQQFLELSRYKSMSQYAAHAGVTHAQVSRMVQELEKELGHQLLIRDRSKSNIELTKKGKTFVKRIPFIFGEIENSIHLVNSDEDLEMGNFDLYTTTFLIDHWIVPELYKLKKKAPHINLNLFGREDIPSPEEKKICFTISPYTEGATDIQQTKLRDFHIGLWASEDYLKRYGRPEHISDLSRHMILCFERKWPERPYPTMNWYMNNSDFALRPENVLVIKSSVGIMNAAKSGLGIFSFAEETIRSIGYSFERVLPDLKGPTLTLCFSYPEAWKGHKSIAIIEEFLVDLFDRKLPHE